MTQREAERDASLTALLKAAMRARLMDLHTALPGKIVAYDAATCTATIQPLIQQRRRQKDGSFAATDYKPAHGCPVMFPRCAGGYITFPLAIGDLGLLVFCEREIGDWVQKAAGESVDPGDGDLHPLDGAVFYPGLYPATSKLSPAPSSSDVEFVASGNLNLGSAGLTATDLAAIGQKVDDAVAALVSNVNTNYAKIVIGIAAGTPGTVYAPTLESSQPSTKATKVRVK